MRSWIGLLTALVASVNAQRPIKVFLLAGQSNMVGFGSIEHLQSLQGREYRQLFTERDDVYHYFRTPLGKLSPINDRGFIGPELGIGWVLGDALGEPIVLLKSAYGGLSLSVDYRPPSSGGTDIVNDAYLQYDHGWYYDRMINEFRWVLQDLSMVYPGYQGQGYEVAGFAWQQGWNDMINERAVPEYGYNLVNFIRDVRRDLGAPNMPFVIGELGMHGPSPDDFYAAQVDAIRQAQEWVTKLPEFESNTKFVPTAQYAVLNGERFDNIHHYYGRADTYYEIGKALGRALLEFQTQSPPAPSIKRNTPGKKARPLDNKSESKLSDPDGARGGLNRRRVRG